MIVLALRATNYLFSLARSFRLVRRPVRWRTSFDETTTIIFHSAILSPQPSFPLIVADIIFIPRFISLLSCDSELSLFETTSLLTPTSEQPLQYLEFWHSTFSPWRAISRKIYFCVPHWSAAGMVGSVLVLRGRQHLPSRGVAVHTDYRCSIFPESSPEMACLRSPPSRAVDF